MAEAFVIIIALGGLEFVLWCLGRKPQKRQIELLHSIWAELAVKKSGDGQHQAVGPTNGGRQPEHTLQFHRTV